MSKECNYLHVFCNKWLRFNVFEFEKVKHAIGSCKVGIPQIWDCTVRKKHYLRLSRRSFYLKSPLLQSTELLQCIICVAFSTPIYTANSMSTCFTLTLFFTLQSYLDRFTAHLHHNHGRSQLAILWLFDYVLFSVPLRIFYSH